ncbi:MAG TPA: HIT family protein, partial [Gammaproteobacteria bacterium]|nr:HIT family protein [Gammaproteobacteria bacterium]
DHDLCLARWDKFPVSPGHMLIIPKRHYASVFEATAAEFAAFWEVIGLVKEAIEKVHKPDGYNFGINDGQAAGQSVFHLHLHVIPRYKGDVVSPLGGVRGVIPFKRSY